MAVALASTGTFLTYALRTNSSIPVPSGVASGDVILAYLYADDSTPTVTAPTGFTELTFSTAPTLTSPNMTVHVYWKRATGADSGTYLFTHGSAHTQAVAMRFTGAVASGTPVEALAGAHRATSAAKSPALSGTTSVANEMLAFVAFVYSTATWTSLSGWTDVHNGDGEYNAVEVQAVAGSTGTIQATSTASNAGIAALVGIIPPASAVSLTASTALTLSGKMQAAGSLALRAATSLYVGLPPLTDSIAFTASATLAVSGVGTWPHLALTATPDTTFSPPRIRLDITDTRTVPATSLTITRLNPDGHYYPVRTSDGGPVSVSGGLATVYDYEAPFDTPLTYTTDDPNQVVTVVTEMDVPQMWLIHPGVPSRSMPVEFRPGTHAQEDWDIDSGSFTILGRDTPIVSTGGARVAPASTLIVAISNADDLAALKLLLSDGSPLLLNVPPPISMGLSTDYIAIGKVSSVRPVDVGTVAERNVVLPYQVVSRPTGGTQASITWDSIGGTYRTWQAIVDAGITSWADLSSPTA